MDNYQQVIKNLNIYVPNRFDDIDNALAEFINNYPNRQKVKIMFIRISKGQYQFGKQRATINLEKNGKLMVRGGGGFKSVSQFLDRYTQTEYEKLEMKDLIDTFTNIS